MSYPGLTFALMVGVAIGTAIYYYFKSENPNANCYEYYAPPPPTTPGYDTGPRTKRRRNSNAPQNCSICFEMLKSATSRRFSCGHIFHDECITKWFRVSSGNTCPNCRAQL